MLAEGTRKAVSIIAARSSVLEGAFNDFIDEEGRRKEIAA